MATTTPPSRRAAAPPPSADASPPTTVAFGRTVTALALTGMLVVGQLYSVLPLLGQMADDWGVDAAATSWTVTSFGLAYAAGFLLSGPLAQRHGERRVIILGLVATAVTTAAVGFAPGLAAACALRALQGLTSATFAPAAFSYLTVHVPPARRPAALTWLTSSFLAAAVVWQVAAQLVTRAGGSWSGVFWLCAPLMLLAALAVRALLRPDGPRPAQAASPVRAMGRVLAQPRLLAAYGSTLTVLGGFVAVYTAAQVAGPESVATDPGALLALRASALPAMLLAPLVIPLLGRFPAARRVAVALGVAALTTVAASFTGDSVTALGCALFVLVGATAFAAPGLVETVGGAAGADRGPAVTLYTFFLFVGASLGPQFAQALRSTGFGGITLAVAALLAVGCALALLAGGARRGPSATGAAAVVGAAALLVATLPAAGTDPAAASPAAPPARGTDQAAPATRTGTPAGLTANHPDAEGTDMSSTPATDTAALLDRIGLSLPAGWQEVSRRRETHDGRQVVVVRHQADRTPRLGGPHVTVVTDADGVLLGVTRMVPPATGREPVGAVNARALALEFFAAVDPEHAAGLSVQWVDRHDETVTDAEGRRHTVPGTKVKTRHQDGGYAWVILGPDGEVVTYERDIAWDGAAGRRGTEMWLHDSWILARDGLGPQPPAPYALARA
ncbi:MFS transporter [Allostreptomyces psammosilenae]|uniref:MFS family permease n=1 Tax=Allostreptomyces psammosilenae TaxID=1892865 RepID=A0A853A467_9ACTN|nr:MFS transporter [Allostreptomyces psammosilenae]NYI08260.1 MFS family permease [Allostreptomyces psammosilenae]